MPKDDRLYWSRFHWSDWLTDTAVQTMTNEQRGAYMQILAWTHQTETPGRMTEEQARGWAQVSKARWPAIRSGIVKAFTIEDDGTWVQKRTVREHEERMRYLESCSSAGVRGSQKRWGTPSQP